MTATTTSSSPATGIESPTVDTPLDVWIDWFWSSLLPNWIDRAHNPRQFGFYDVLDSRGHPVSPDRRTLLAQARLLFVFSLLALHSEHPAYHRAARLARDAVRTFRRAPGQYCFARASDGRPTGNPSDLRARSYDLSFVILGLSTWGKLHIGEDVEELEACWQMLDTRLTDPSNGLLLEHDNLESPSDADAPPRAQNPHMHNYEAALQAFEMTGERIWLERAKKMRTRGLDYFFDETSGTIREFIAPDLTLLPGRDGQYREIGHQFEWAWLLMREAELSGVGSTLAIADRLLAFADRHGVAQSGPMQGAAFDAVSVDLDWREKRYLLWPQTEALKVHAVRAHLDDHGDRAKDTARLMFVKYFSGQTFFINQIDDQGAVIWSEALSRLHYHTVLALFEGARAGLWAGPKIKK